MEKVRSERHNLHTSQTIVLQKENRSYSPTLSLLSLAGLALLGVGLFYAAVYANRSIAINYNRFDLHQTLSGQRYVIGFVVGGASVFLICHLFYWCCTKEH